MKPETIALNQIYYNLLSGRRYGQDVLKWANGDGPRFPYFSEAISYGTDRDGTKIFRWTHYGSSANRATKTELKWIIKTIFKTTAEQFQRDYITSDQSKIDWLNHA